MWDAIKKAAGSAMEWGASYIRHSAAIEQILISPTYEHGAYALRAYVFSIESPEEFQRFKETIVQQSWLAQQAQTDAGNSWGGSTEDRIAYQMAHIQTGAPSGTLVAQQRLQALAVMYQFADQFWFEAEQARAAVAAGTQQPPPTPET